MLSVPIVEHVLIFTLTPQFIMSNGYYTRNVQGGCGGEIANGKVERPERCWRNVMPGLFILTPTGS